MRASGFSIIEREGREIRDCRAGFFALGLSVRYSLKFFEVIGGLRV
jgi:hypothetical protein